MTTQTRSQVLADRVDRQIAATPWFRRRRRRELKAQRAFLASLSQPASVTVHLHPDLDGHEIAKATAAAVSDATARS
jgi:hypothetical protein